MFCRLCVFECNEENSTDIFNNTVNSSLTKLIVKYLFLEICEDDNFSTIVCNDCLQHLKEFENFLLKIEQRQLILNEVFLSSNASKNLKSHHKSDKDENNEYFKSKTSCHKSRIDTQDSSDAELSMEANYMNETESDATHEELSLNLEFVDTQADDDDELDVGSSIEDENNLLLESSKQEAEIANTKDLNFNIHKNASSKTSFGKEKDLESKVKSNQRWKTRAQQMKDNKELIEKHADLKCDICGAISINFKNFQAHFQREHNQKAYIKCCRLRLENKWAIANHLKSHLDPECFKCPICNKTISNKYYLPVHIRKYHGENKNPQNDITQENSSTKIKSNMQKKKENDKFIEAHVVLKCEICGLISDTCDNFHAHYRDEHNQKAFIRCCGLKFVKNFVVIQHIKSHINPVNLRCSFCQKDLSNMACLKAHIRRYHTDENVLTSVCGICDKRFLHSNALKVHMKVHEDSKNYKCDTCDKIFKYESALKAHRKRDHENFGRSVCHLCGAEYKYKQLYDQHMAKKHDIYARNNLKQCGDCQKWFSLSNLKKHEERHKLQDVECDRCGRILPSKVALSKHKKHHPKTKFKGNTSNKDKEK